MGTIEKRAQRNGRSLSVLLVNSELTYKRDAYKTPTSLEVEQLSYNDLLIVSPGPSVSLVMEVHEQTPKIIFTSK